MPKCMLMHTHTHIHTDTQASEKTKSTLISYSYSDPLYPPKQMSVENSTLLWGKMMEFAGTGIPIYWKMNTKLICKSSVWFYLLRSEYLKDTCILV